MNERIKQLAVEAKLIALEPNGFDQNNLSKAQEKFAQLIVHEMLKTCEEHPGWYGRDIGEQIKQRFGVKS